MMKRQIALQIPILFFAAGCGGRGLGVSALRDGGLVGDAFPDLTASFPDALEPVYRHSTQRFVQVWAGGGDEACGLKSDGSMLCWGYFGDFPVSSALGTGYVPRPASDGWKQASPAAGFACGIKNDDTLACFGFDWWGSLQPPTGTYLALDARAPCAIRSPDGGIVCWGSANWLTASVPEGSFKALSIGDAGCGLKTDDTVVCWGSSRIMAAMGATPDGTFTQVVVTGLSACGLREDGQLVCWGSTGDWSGTDAREAPQPEGTFVQIAGGADAACGIRMDGTLACWGMVWGFLPPEGSYVQVSVGSTEDVVSVYFCALRTDGIVVCWGGNLSGESSPP